MLKHFCNISYVEEDITKLIYCLFSQRTGQKLIAISVKALCQIITKASIILTSHSLNRQ